MKKDIVYYYAGYDSKHTWLTPASLHNYKE